MLDHDDVMETSPQGVLIGIASVSHDRKQFLLLGEYSFFVFPLVALSVFKGGGFNNEGKSLDSERTLNCKAEHIGMNLNFGYLLGIYTISALSYNLVKSQPEV